MHTHIRRISSSSLAPRVAAAAAAVAAANLLAKRGHLCDLSMTSWSSCCLKRAAAGHLLAPAAVYIRIYQSICLLLFRTLFYFAVPIRTFLL